MTSTLRQKRCTPCTASTPALNAEQLREYLGAVEGWQLDADQKSIFRVFELESFHETMALANAVAWIAHREDHHPDLELSYKRCLVRYSTHAIGGLTENDFICAAKVDSLVD